VKLVELEPRWIHPNMFVFLCPHCREIFLTCKNIEMMMHEQVAIFEREFGEDWANRVVPAREGVAWSIAGYDPNNPGAAFQTGTVTPSIDASASGHWHGHITNGLIV
jgi:hypothetical protein